MVYVYEKSSQAAQSRANLILIIASIVVILLLIALIYVVLRLRRK